MTQRTIELDERARALLVYFRSQSEDYDTQEKLAAAIGTSRVSLARWESGMRPIDVDMLTAICELLGLEWTQPPAYLTLKPQEPEAQQKTPPKRTGKR